MSTIKKTKLPEDFRPLMWGYDFNKIDPELNIDRIVVNTVNYGFWEHWQWIANYYGKERIKKLIENLPASEFQKRALKLAMLLFNIKKMKYASRGDKIKKLRSF